VDSPKDLATTYRFILKSKSDRRLIKDWADSSLRREPGHEFPQDEQFRKALPIALFSTIAEHWGEYAEDAISEDAAFTAIIREFLEAYDKFLVRPGCLQSWNSLHYCAYRNWCVPLQLLIDDGMDINTPTLWIAGDAIPWLNGNGETPLGVALSVRSHDVFRMLLKNEQVDVNAKTFDGKTPLMTCANEFHEYSAPTARELLARPDLKVNEEDNNGYTALLTALRRGNKDTVEELLRDPRLSLQDNGFDDTTDKAGVLALMGQDIPKIRK
jgi:hypothetical protein